MDKQKILPFLTFNGKSEEAMNFYASVLPNTTITRLERYGNSPHVTAGNENLVMHGAIKIGNEQIIFLDMDKAYAAPEFNWAISIMINCDTEAEFDAFFGALENSGGNVMMGPASVGQVRKCAWVADKFGVTWQPVWA